jgi:hypothetical protein
MFGPPSHSCAALIRNVPPARRRCAGDRPARLRDVLESLPAPRVRTHAPKTTASAGRTVLDAFTRGLQAELREFKETAVWAWADGYRWPRIEPVPALRGVNVVAVKEGPSSDALVVVAHHDTLPRAGGVDNGSCVVAPMELARLLRPLPLRRSAVLTAVDHEELGFLGCRRRVRDVSVERRD